MDQVAEIADWEWLVSEAARPYLEFAARETHSALAAVSKLRRELTPARAHLVFEQADLRRRARAKFARAESLFFTRSALEQATDEHVAAYKASRFPAHALVADLCCGTGGDLLALAQRGPVVGVEKNAAVSLLAAANAKALGLDRVSLATDDVRALECRDFAAWHIDPDRRAAGVRTSAPEWYEPGVEEIDRWRAAVPEGAVKLAPAAEIPAHWEAVGEQEWIGHERECKQLVVWFGALAQHGARRRATVVRRTGTVAFTFVGEANGAVPCAATVGQYVFEPHAAVLAARLGSALAASQELEQLAPEVAYYTGNERRVHGALAAFEVLEVLPFDMRTLRGRLRERGVGRLEIKKRGLPNDPARVRRELQLEGPGEATLLLSPGPKGRALAILARRIEPEPVAAAGRN